MERRLYLSPLGAILLMAPLLMSGCGDEPSLDGGVDGRTHPAIASIAPAISPAPATSAAPPEPTTDPITEPTAEPAGEVGPDEVSVSQVNAVCQRTLDSYWQNKDPEDPVASQLVSSQVVGRAASELGAVGSDTLAPLVSALRDYAASGARLGAAMANSDFATVNRLVDENQAIGSRVEVAATRLGAATCAQLAGI